MIHANVQYSLMPSQYEAEESKLRYYEEIASYAHSSSFYPLAEIKVGETKYRLLSPIDALVNYDPNEKQWECRTRRLKYIGLSNESREAAIEDFNSQIHVSFQQLYSKRPFEMTKDEYVEWIKIANTIDLLHYKTTTPLKIREIGCVSYGKLSYPYRIKWLTDENYIIHPANVPAELMSYKTGQWIEAIVERNPVNNRLFRISSVRKIKFRIPRPGDVQKYWDNMEKIELDNQSG